MKLQPNQQVIIDLLADGQKHCPSVELYMKDDRSRISALRKLGYRFNEGAGYCKNPLHNHRSGVKLRQLITYPALHETAPQAPIPALTYLGTTRPFEKVEQKLF